MFSKEDELELLRIIASIASYSFCEGMFYPNNTHEKEETEKYWNILYEFLRNQRNR